MAVSAGKIITLVVGLLILGLLLPIGLEGILEFTSDNSTVETIVTILLPLLVVVGILMSVAPSGGGKGD